MEKETKQDGYVPDTLQRLIDWMKRGSYVNQIERGSYIDIEETKPDGHVHNLLQRLIDNKSKPKKTIAQKRKEKRDAKNWIKKENKLQKEADKLKRKEKKDKRVGIYLVRKIDKKDKVIRVFMKVTRKGGQINDGMEKVNS